MALTARVTSSRFEAASQISASWSTADCCHKTVNRFTGGLANYYEVLESQQELFPAENALARNRLDELLSIVALYRALGGGWQQATP